MSLFIVGSVLIKHILSRTKWDTVLCGMNQLLVMTMRTWHSIDCGEMVTVSDSSWGHQLVPCGCYCEEWVGQLWSKWSTEELIMTILCLLRNIQTVLSRPFSGKHRTQLLEWLFWQRGKSHESCKIPVYFHSATPLWHLPCHPRPVFKRKSQTLYLYSPCTSESVSWEQASSECAHSLVG